MKAIVLLAVLAALATLWWSERVAAARLEIEVEARRTEARDVAALLRERDRLRGLQPSAAELAALRHAGAQRAELQLAIEAHGAERATSSGKLDLGEWRPAGSWRNCGRATPNAAIETMLWAAAGGDISTLKTLLSIGDDTRQKVEALLASLPATGRERYATIEDLIADFTVKGIPVGSAQLVWFNQSSDDDATACVFLQKAAPATSSVAVTPSPAAVSREEAIARAAQLKAERAAHPDREPPRAADNGLGNEPFLSLHREGDGWRLIVPPSIVDIIAKQLARPPAR